MRPEAPPKPQLAICTALGLDPRRVRSLSIACSPTEVTVSAVLALPDAGPLATVLREYELRATGGTPAPLDPAALQQAWQDDHASYGGNS